MSLSKENIELSKSNKENKSLMIFGSLGNSQKTGVKQR